MNNKCKRILALLMSVLLMVSLCCCKSTSDSESAYSSEDNVVSDVLDDTSSDATTDTSSDDMVNSSEDSNDGNSVIGEVSSNDPSLDGSNVSNGTTVIQPSGNDKPTTSTSSNTNGEHTITATYEWHPGLPDVDVTYKFGVLVDNVPVNSGDVTITTKTSGIKVDGNKVTIPYSVRQANKTVSVTVKHKSGTKCDVNIPCYKYTQTFNDDFDGTHLDRTKWGETQAYATTPPSDAASYTVIDRSRPVSNCLEVKDGKLILYIKKEPCYDASGKIKYLYSDGMISTSRGSDPFMQTYGLFQSRLACAEWSGVNTAFWIVPNGSHGTQYMNFKTDEPSIGLSEIDIIEASVAFGKSNRKTFCISEHFYNYKNNYSHTQQSSYYEVSDSITNYHTYSCVWTADGLYYYVDDTNIRNTTGLQAKSAGGKTVTRAHMICSIALYEDEGWVGKRDFDDSALPITASYDWVRAYKFN